MRKPALKVYALALSLSATALTVPAYAATEEMPSSSVTEATASGAMTSQEDRNQEVTPAQTAVDLARTEVKIEAQPSVHPGEKVTIKVSGLDSGERVTVTVRDSGGKVVATLPAPRTERGTGETTVQWSVPADASLGTYSLTVDPQRATTSIDVVALPAPPKPSPEPEMKPENGTPAPESNSPETKAPSVEESKAPQDPATTMPQAPATAGAVPSTNPSAKAQKGQSLAQTGVEGTLLVLAASVLALGGVALRLRSRA